MYQVIATSSKAQLVIITNASIEAAVEALVEAGNNAVLRDFSFTITEL